MRPTRLLILLLALVLAALAAPVAAQAALPDLTGFHLSSPLYFVNENAGAAVIEVDRLNTTVEGQVRYIALPITAEKNIDFTPVKGMLDFQVGQASATFSIPIIDHGVPGLPKTINVGLFGPSPIGMSVPANAVLTILNNDPAPTLTKNAFNPLALPTPPPPTDPLTGASAFVEPKSLASNAARHYRHSKPAWSHALDVIAKQPNVQRYGNWSGPNPGLQVSQYLARASVLEPGTVPELATYYVVDAKRSAPACHHYADPPWRQGAYHKWIQSLASGIGSYRAIVFLEMDSLITTGCLSRHGLAVRLAELHDAIDILSQLPRVVVYLDAGAGDAVPAADTASMLRRAGVSEIEGFYVNSTHFDWTSHEIRYGEQISALTGGKHFVVNTAENGRGPLVPSSRVKYGNEILCDPPGRGLGPLPSFNTGIRKVDAFAWIAYPGRSGGQCRPGAPPTGVFWPQLAVELVRHANFSIR
ncbi:MAG TPA: glycoside hydrolase family 6 protein [Solirubrobacteraceae bacterium]|jgi:endoglucanase|nr:glycoside hydrolase family 6 protein [Solirubrobacteraceae bacterium]